MLTSGHSAARPIPLVVRRSSNRSGAGGLALINSSVIGRGDGDGVNPCAACGPGAPRYAGMVTPCGSTPPPLSPPERNSPGTSLHINTPFCISAGITAAVLR